MHPVLFVALLHALGTGVVLYATRGTAPNFAAASGLLWGLALYALLATAILLGTYVGLPLPRLHATASLVLAALLAALAWIGTLRREKARMRLLAVPAGGFVVAGLVTAAALRLNASVLSVDSFAFIELGLALARITQPEYAHLTFLGARPMLPVLIHGLTVAVEEEYLHFLPVIMTAYGVATLSLASFVGVRRHGRSPAAATLALGLGLAALASSYFVAFQSLYVHSNALAGWFVLLFFVCTWMAVDTRSAPGWWALAALALWAFSLTRLEGPLFAAVFLGALALDDEAGLEQRPGVVLGLAGPGLLNCLLGAAAAGEAGRIAGSGRWLAMGAALGLAALIPMARRHPAIRARLRAPRPAAAVAALAILAVAVAAAPAPTPARALALAQNAFVTGNWSGLWALFAALALASPLLGRMRHERVPLLASAGFLALLVALSVIAGWRLGWGDSGNRMLTHLVPTLAWVAVVKAATLAPAEARASRGGTPDA